tara:strand:+ start:121 stop:420 length:300 start_codon:yes stop_codon:yes gene_type:complete
MQGTINKLIDTLDPNRFICVDCKKSFDIIKLSYNDRCESCSIAEMMENSKQYTSSMDYIDYIDVVKEYEPAPKVIKAPKVRRRPPDMRLRDHRIRSRIR